MSYQITPEPNVFVADTEAERDAKWHEGSVVYCKDSKKMYAVIDEAFVEMGGGVVQTVNTQTGAVATGTTTIPLDDTIPQNTEGDEYMTLAITPTSATNKLKIDVVWSGGNTYDGSHHISTALFQDSTTNALAAATAGSPIKNRVVNNKFTHYMTAGTTNATTFKVRAGGSNTGTTTFNGLLGGRYFGGVMASSITITEITA